MKRTELICDMCGEVIHLYGTGPALEDSLVLLDTCMPENEIYTPAPGTMKRYHLHNYCCNKLLKWMKAKVPE